MLLSEVSPEGWTAIASGIAGAMVIVIGALGAWWLKIQQSRDATLLATKKLDVTALRSRETIKELNEAIEQLGNDRDEDRKEIHSLRDRCHASEVRLMVCETKLKACEDDRTELHRHNIRLSNALAQKGIYLPFPEDTPKEPTPPSNNKSQ